MHNLGLMEDISDQFQLARPFRERVSGVLSIPEWHAQMGEVRRVPIVLERGIFLDLLGTTIRPHYHMVLLVHILLYLNIIGI